jgi:rod shape-determining protein MreB
MSRRDVAVDLGSANTRVYQLGQGVVFDQPTVAAINARTGQVLAVGDGAVELMAEGRAEVVPIRPVDRGVIVDYDLAEQFLRAVFRSIGAGRLARPKALACVPSGLTAVERRAVEDALSSAGARSITLIEKPMAAAVGAGLPVHEPVGNLVVDVGGGITEIGLVAMGGVVAGSAVRVGGFDMDAAIHQFVRRRHGVSVGEATGERLKVQIGSAYPTSQSVTAQVRGRDMTSGTPRSLVVTPDEVREALSGVVGQIVDGARECLAEAPAELAHDVLETGLFLTGGGALLRGLDMRLARDCEVPVHVTEQPLHTVALGAGRLLEYLPDFRSAFFATSKA